MSITGYVKDRFRGIRLVNALAEEYYLMKQDNETMSRMISPDRLEVYDTHLLIDEHTYVRCIVVGMEDNDVDVNAIPPQMTSRALERIMQLSFNGCKIDISTGLIKIPRVITAKQLKEDYISNSIDQDVARKHTAGSINDIQLENESNDIRETYNDIYYNARNMYNVTFIITVMGKMEEVKLAEAQITAILNTEIISYMIPYNMMLEAFIASRMYPVSDQRFWINVNSDIAATLCVSTSLNSRLDDKGLLFGKDRKTNAEVVIDIASLPSQHMIVFGPTQSGKTFSMSVLQMRLHDMMNKRIVYITPKDDGRTDFKAVAHYYGDGAITINIGEFGQPINPLRIVFDSKSMGNSPEAYSYAYFRHIRTLKSFFGEWFGVEFSANMKGYLEDTLNTLYKSKGIIRTKPETWKGAFPVMSDLREYFKRDMNDESGSSDTRKSAGALYRKTSAIGADGSLSYLNQDNNFDFSKDYIVIDISGVDEELRKPMYILVTGIVGSRFRTDLEKETAVIVDEGRVFLRSKELSDFLLDAVSMGASHGMQLILMTQNPIDLIKNNVDQEFKANMPLSLVFGATLDSEKVKPIQQYFGLSTTAVEDLLNCDQGQGLLLISSRREEIPLHVEATEQEKAIIKGTYEKKKAQVGYSILPEYQALREHHGVILKTWVQGDESYLIREGWEKITNLQKATGKGSFSMFVPVGSIQGDQIKLPGLGSMTLEHFSSVVQMESYLVAQKIECYSDHNQGADIVFVKNGRTNGRTYAIEYERGTRSEEDLIKKRDRLLEYDDYRFVCSPENFEHISKIVDKTIQRGRSFADWVESLPA